MVTVYKATEHSGAGAASDAPDTDLRLRVTVLFTTAEATLRALQMAGDLTRGLAARIMLAAIQGVPFPLSLNRPSIPVDFLERHMRDLVSRAHLEFDEVSIQICICRDREQGLQQLLPPHSLIVLGGTRRWWSRERRLQRRLARLGHHVVFVDVESRRSSRPGAVLNQVPGREPMTL